MAHDNNGKFVLVLFNKLMFHLDSREKMRTVFLVCHAPAGASQLRVSRAIFFFKGCLIPFAWKGFFPVFCEFFAPAMNRTVGDAQLASNLRNRLARCLYQSHSFLFEIFCIDLLDLS